MNRFMSKHGNPVRTLNVLFTNLPPCRYTASPHPAFREISDRIFIGDINSESIGTTPLVVVGILYFLVRIVGKYAGAFLGCLVTKKDKKVRNFLGLALIPQAGVAIGLAATGARTLGGEVGNALETIILASSVLYELIGPACAKLSLYLSGSYSNKLEDLAPIPATEPGQPPKSEVELLIERIQAIQQELPKHNNPYYEDEQAFTEAAAEHSAQMEAFFGTPGKANTAMPGRKRK